jgi:hypothetical protein
MARRAGCQRSLFIVGVGCFSLVILVVGVLGVAVIWAGASYRRMGAPEAEPADRKVVLSPALTGGDEPSPAMAGTTASDRDGQEPLPAIVELPSSPATPFSRRQPVRLTIDLMEGEFEIRPGAPGSDLRVEGTYSPLYYELTDERTTGDLGDEILLRLAPKVGFFTRMIAGLTEIGERHPNRLIVILPQDVPIALSLRLSAGASRSDLGGLNLTDLKTDFSKGTHHIDFGKPLKEDLEQMDLKLAMGEGEILHVGNAGPRSLHLETRMGTFRIDLGGDWAPGSQSEVNVAHSMGDLTLLIPAEVRVDDRSSNRVVFGGMQAESLKETGHEPEDAPVLKLHTRTSMGGIQIRRR